MKSYRMRFLTYYIDPASRSFRSDNLTVDLEHDLLHVLHGTVCLFLSYTWLSPCPSYSELQWSVPTSSPQRQSYHCKRTWGAAMQRVGHHDSGFYISWFHCNQIPNRSQVSRPWTSRIFHQRLLSTPSVSKEQETTIFNETKMQKAKISNKKSEKHEEKMSKIQ